MLKRIDGSLIDVQSIIPEHFANGNNFANWIQDQINTGYHGKFIERLDKKDDIAILDIGANCGLFSAYVAPVCSKLVSIEPDELHFANLQKVKAKFFDFAEIKKVAVSEERGSQTFYRSNDNSAMNSLLKTKDNHKNIVEYQVEVVTINDIIDEFGEFDYMKVDIEGGEQSLIYSMTEETALKIKTIHVEYHPDSFGISNSQIILHLRKLGYEVETYEDIIYAERKIIGF